MTAPVFAFSCTACGKCCKHGGPALSIDEVFKYQNTFISGLRWTGHAIPKKYTMPFKGEIVDAQKMRNHLASFAAPSFDDKGNTIQPHIYPLVTGYALGRGCNALNADETCSLHANKPTMCRSVPFDPAMPEHMQDIILRDFGLDCVTETQAPDAANVIYRDGRITDASCKADYDRRLAVMQKDKSPLATLSYFMSEKPSALAPARADFMQTVDRGGWVETTMLPLLLVLLKNEEITRQVAGNYLHSQIALIDTGISAALERHHHNERGRTEMMRKYVTSYRKCFDDKGELVSPSE
jgi:Fe-S-cluster containining protein